MQSNNHPTVSVIIPAYNQSQFVSQAIDSVLAQTFTDYEIIVINDGSTDNTAEVLEQYKDRICIITQTNAGLSAARNSGLRIARGEVVGLLDADDVWYPEALSAVVSYLRKNPHIDLVSGAWDNIDESGKTIRGLTRSSGFQPMVQADFLKTFALGTLFPPSSVVIRRRCFDCCGFFDTTLKALEDWDFWLRLAIHGHKLDLMDTPVVHYRRHRGCMTLEPQRMERAFHQVLAKLFSEERVAARLADLRVHAYLIQWLYLAEYCQEAGLVVDLQRCLQKAEELYSTVPFNEELNRRYFSLASALPYAEHFVRTVGVSIPEVLLSHCWRLFKEGSYRDALLGLIKLATRQPNWVIRKAFHKVKQNLLRIQANHSRF